MHKSSRPGTTAKKKMAPIAPQSPGSSILVKFDDLMRQNKVLLDPSESEFLTFAQNTGCLLKRCSETQRELVRVQELLQKSENEVEMLNKRLNLARQLLSVETARAKKAEQDKEMVTRKVDMMKDLLSTGDIANTINDETRQKLKRLSETIHSLHGFHGGVNTAFSPGNFELSRVEEINSTASILDASDLSFDATCEGLEESKLRSGRNYKRKSSSGAPKRRSKKSRESMGIPPASTTLQQPSFSANQYVSRVVTNTRKSLEKIAARKSIQKSGSMEPDLPVEYQPSAPPAPAIEEDGGGGEVCWRNAHQQSPQASVGAITPSVRRNFSNAGLNSRKHMFEQKKIYKMESCTVCGGRISFSKVAFKCRECRSIAHPECKDKVPLPCVGVGSGCKTPAGKVTQQALADFTPLQAPMVPALIVHCVNEIESKGLDEVGLYRVPGSEREVRELKEKFLKGKGCPNLSKVDAHVLAGCIKDFLRNLKEPLIPRSMWHTFAQACNNPDETDALSALYQAVGDLPQPNRDTLAFLTLHFRRVADCVENKMNVSNLAKILGPTVMGYSSPEPDHMAMMSELGTLQRTMERILSVDTDYWSTYIEVEGEQLYSNNILSPHTPDYRYFKVVSSAGHTPVGNRMERHSSIGSSATPILPPSNRGGMFASPMLR